MSFALSASVAPGATIVLPAARSSRSEVMAANPTRIKTVTAIARFWDDAVVPTLLDYIRIPAKSPHFDHEWARHGHIDAAVKLAAEWCKRHAVSGMKLEVVRLADRTPVLFIDVPPNGNAGSSANVLIYGHL